MRQKASGSERFGSCTAPWYGCSRRLSSTASASPLGVSLFTSQQRMRPSVHTNRSARAMPCQRPWAANHMSFWYGVRQK